MIAIDNGLGNTLYMATTACQKLDMKSLQHSGSQ